MISTSGIVSSLSKLRLDTPAVSSHELADRLSFLELRAPAGDGGARRQVTAKPVHPTVFQAEAMAYNPKIRKSRAVRAKKQRKTKAKARAEAVNDKLDRKATLKAERHERKVRLQVAA